MKNITPGSNNGGTASANGPANSIKPSGAPLLAIPDALQPRLPKLAQAKVEELERLEEIIYKSWNIFLEVGQALIKIQADQLYLDLYATFEEYCRDRLNISRQYAYNLIGSAEVYTDLSAMADIEVKPTNERQIRSIRSVPKEKWRQVWKKAVRSAKGQPVTGKLVSQVAAEFKPKRTGNSAEAKRPSKFSAKFLPAFKLLDDMEKLAADNQRLLDKLTALRGILQSFEGK